jgi:hypothetical protein
MSEKEDVFDEYLFMKRKERLADYKAGQLGAKTKKWLLFPEKIYQHWQAHWVAGQEEALIKSGDLPLEPNEVD